MSAQREKILEKYAMLLADVDKQTSEVYARAPEIPCRNKCYDCCRQLFPVSFAEAFYMSDGFKTLPRNVRRERTRTAEKIREKILARDPLQFEKRGVTKEEALAVHSTFAKFLHEIKTDCPTLDRENPAGACTVYSFRNHDCRSMGFSFDSSERAIAGCFRFDSLKHLAPKLIDFSYRYAEKTTMDRQLISEVTGGIFTSNILYYTTMCGPLLKDYAAEDWKNFFEEKGVSTDKNSEAYLVVIDV